MKKKSKPQFAARKRAFDSVMDAYRQARDQNGGMGSITISDSGKGVSNPVRPSLTDFRCDVEKVLARCLKSYRAKRDFLTAYVYYKRDFLTAYVYYDSEDTIDLEMHAQQVIGDGRHGLEQGIGALFIKYGL